MSHKQEHSSPTERRNEENNDSKKPQKKKEKLKNLPDHDTGSPSTKYTSHGTDSKDKPNKGDLSSHTTSGRNDEDMKAKRRSCEVNASTPSSSKDETSLPRPERRRSDSCGGGQTHLTWHSGAVGQSAWQARRSIVDNKKYPQFYVGELAVAELLDDKVS